MGHHHHREIDDSQIPGTVQLVDVLDGEGGEGGGGAGQHHLATRHAQGAHKDIILVPTPSADPEDPLNWSPGRKRLALAGILA